MVFLMYITTYIEKIIVLVQLKNIIMKVVVVIVVNIGEVVVIQLEFNITNVQNVIINILKQLIIQNIINENNLLFLFVRNVV